ncbi:hypothetical protein KUTeg_000510 [Tegillarca granosa]|uniref:G-protein coupled receptors family 1 profile domain-containing protein n=1 Tax=Tegillarca granosa TaxID=220873 RepID=A0ABQ9FXS8_TEGGR|nr:hypothetical protein KUTeg_000510 [Tegillarca granosa]
MEGNIFCNEDVDVTKMNGEQPNTIYMDPIENQLTKETNVANKNQVFDLSVISNRGQIHCQSSENNTYINVKPHTTKEPKTRKTYNRERQAKRITLMLFIITLVFVLSFIPHLTLKILAFVRKDFLTSLSYTQLFLYHTFVWSFFINNMANPIIYGFCDSI